MKKNGKKCPVSKEGKIVAFVNGKRITSELLEMMNMSDIEIMSE